jgi:hypothetical protein
MEVRQRNKDSKGDGDNKGDADNKGDEDSNITQILRKFRCEWRHCSNFGLACLDAGRKRHFKLNSNDLKKWHFAILANKDTVDIPPLDLHPMLAKSTQKRRNGHDYSSDIEDSHESRQSRRSNSQNISVHLHQEAQQPKRRYYSSSPPSSPIKRPRARSPPRSPFSSPSVRDISLSEYIMWHVTKAPEDAEAYLSALETLKGAHIKVHQFPLLTQAQWESKFGISWGICTSLKDRNQQLPDREKAWQSAPSFFKANMKI